MPLGGGRRVGTLERREAEPRSLPGQGRERPFVERGLFTLGDNFAQRPGCQMFAAVSSLLSSAFYKIEKLSKKVAESLSSLQHGEKSVEPQTGVPF